MPTRSPGTYVLILQLAHPVAPLIGALGRAHFSPGWYAYVGSARGPGGLAARVGRHLQAEKRPHWHLDYLRPHAQPVALGYITGPSPRECAWAAQLAQHPQAHIPAARFGASDCRCPAHLFHFDASLDPPTILQAIADPLIQEIIPIP